MVWYLTVNVGLWNPVLFFLLWFAWIRLKKISNSRDLLGEQSGKVEGSFCLIGFSVFQVMTQFRSSKMGEGRGVKLTDSSRLETFNFPQNSDGGEEIREMSEGVRLKWSLITLSCWCVLTEGRNQRPMLLNMTRRLISDLGDNTTFTLQLSDLICAQWRSTCTNEKRFLLQLILQTVA